MTGPSPHPTMGSEVALLAAAAEGDRDAVRWLLDDVAPVVYGFIFARVGADPLAAEDLLQDTLLEAVRSASSFRGEARVSTWLCAIARRRVARHFEYERKAALAHSRLREVEDEPLHDEVKDLDERDEITRALGRLTPLHRQVLVLKYMDEQSIPDIASAVGRTRVQVQSLLQRARESLRRELAAGDA